MSRKADVKILQNYEVVEVKPDFSLDIFSNYKKKLEEIYTDRKHFVVSFDLIGVNAQLANSIRRTILCELEIKALTFDVTTIKTNVDFLISDELLDRVQFLPIDQSISDDTILTLSALNQSDEIVPLYSSSISNNAVSKRFRLVELRPGNFLHIPEIRVIKGKGRDHSMFSLTNKYSFDNLDFMDVAFINAKGNRIRKRVMVTQLYKRLHPTLDKTPTIPDLRKLRYERVLVIPNKIFEAAIDSDERARIDVAHYDHVLINSDPTIDANEFLPEQSSFEAESQEFRMSFHLTNQIDPKTLISITCDNLITRLGIIQSLLLEGKHFTQPITVRHGDEQVTLDMWCMTVMNETHTIGELLVRHVYMCDPDIPFVRKFMNHPKDNRFTLQILHPNAADLAKDAIADCIKIFEQIQLSS